MRETRKVRSAEASRSSPTTYQAPASWKSAYGLTVRSRSSSREIDQYGNLTVRCFEIAPSSLPSRPCISAEYSGSSTSTRMAVSVGASAKPGRPSARFCSASRSGSA